ncbi:uroporphyrinogen-III C-methyltransferase [Marilutibacter aestuarii]|uniref:Uroporphyrin-III methyltransferase n=1 Tax=Marilutibacter aestuarii TaxID=1706195 RepID=A0A508ACA5_9GAMM|nr:uroporphyrinogen-III C-methyltransferase [Lysobacter aestuarii]TQD45468.1 hypothetical protein FKV25_07995 [Lysobacter aestuarii]
MSDPRPSTPEPARRRSGGGFVLLLVVLAALLAAGVYAWRQWQAQEQRQASERAMVADADHRIDALNERLNALRADQNAQSQRLQQADATNRIMRDELLGIGQRAALLEDSVMQLSDPARTGVQALRLEEVELMLMLGEQRLRVAGDLEGARRNYAMAADALDTIKDPANVDLRQALIQERQALDALEADPRAQVLAEIAAFADALGQAPAATPERPELASGPWWKRAFANVFDIQPRERVIAESPSDRADAMAALQLELTLARVAAERRDGEAFRKALARADGWLGRLWPPSAELDARRSALEAIAARPVTLSIPTLGSTLEQLRQSRGSHPEAP